MCLKFSLHEKKYYISKCGSTVLYEYFTAKEHWNKHPTTGAYYQLNTQSALSWSQAEFSCKQQVSSLLSITDPNEQAYVLGKVLLTLRLMYRRKGKVFGLSSV